MMNPDFKCLPWCQVLGILAAATVLGFAYNQASPLGVRATRPGTTEETTPKRLGFSNETLSLTLESSTAAPVPAIPQAIPQQARQIPHLTWAQVKPLIAKGNIVIVDARAKATYDLGHIPGAVSLPANASLAEFQSFAKAHPPSTAIIGYCGSESCNASRQTLEALIRTGGYTNVSDMPGGYAEYLAAQGPEKP